VDGWQRQELHGQRRSVESDEFGQGREGQKKEDEEKGGLEEEQQNEPSDYWDPADGIPITGPIPLPKQQ
jgi:hypothetical protein